MKKIIFIILGIVMMCCSATNNPNKIFCQKYPNINMYYAVYSKGNKRFSGFKKFNIRPHFGKYAKLYYQKLNGIIDSLNFINWESDTVYSIIDERYGVAIWNNRAGYYVYWIHVPGDLYFMNYNVKKLKEYMTTEDSFWTESNKLFISAWTGIDTTEIKNILFSSGHINSILDLSQYIIHQNKVLNYTEYVFLDAIRWRKDSTGTNNINLYTDKDDWHMLGY